MVGEGTKTGSNVGLGEVQLTGVTQTSASEPGNVLNKLQEAKNAVSTDAFSTFRKETARGESQTMALQLISF